VILHHYYPELIKGGLNLKKSAGSDQSLRKPLVCLGHMKKALITNNVAMRFSLRP